MAMSSLGAQLSALTSTSNNKGIVHSTSRTNNDAIGRGFHHSNKYGHSLLTGGGGGDDVTRRPSVLYDNAREAAEVTTVTLRENAFSSLEQLCEILTATDSGSGGSAESLWKDAEFVGSQGLLSLHNLNNFERGTATPAKNIQIDAAIEKLMNLLMSVVVEYSPPTAANGEDGDVNSNPILLATLHIIEYLLRHYAIHSRPTTANLMVQTFLPLQIAFPTSYPQLFSRILSLVDLQGMPQWTWLRPYAARDAPPLGRGTLAKFVARDDALVRVIMNVAKRGMEVCVEEGRLAKEMEMQIDGVAGEDEDEDSKVLEIRRGISTLLSFSASVLVEALHIQSTSKDAGIVGGVQEGMVRTMFPLILSACAHGSSSGSANGALYCSEWKEWGRLLASTCAMLCPLKEDVKVAFCDAIVQGLPASMNSGKKSFHEAVTSLGSTENALSGREMDDASSAIMTLLSVLGAMNKCADDSSDDDEDEGWENYLPMLPPKKKRKNAIVDYLGCELPASAYKHLFGKSGDSAVSFAMGAILQSLEDDEEGVKQSNTIISERMMPLVASILMHAFVRLEKDAGKVLKSAAAAAAKEGGSAKKKKRKSKGGVVKDDADNSVLMKCKADRDVLLILSLIKEPSLSSLWRSKSSALVAAVTVQTISSYNKLNHSQDSNAMILERYASILKALSSTKSVVYDQGVAYAINTVVKKSTKKDKEGQLVHLAKLLGCEDASLVAASTSKGKTADNKVDLVVSSLLPPRVALESGDASVRLDAIARLKASIENEDGDDELDADLGQALLRRLATDDDAGVASAAGEIVASQLKQLMLSREEDVMDEDNNKVSAFESLTDDLAVLAKEALSSLYRWTFIGKDGDLWSPDESKSKNKKGKQKKSTKGKEELAGSPLASCMRICGSVIKLILKEEALDESISNDLFCTLFLSLGAHVNSAKVNDEVSEVASTELMQIIDNGSSCASVSDLVTKHAFGHNVLTHFFNDQAHEKTGPDAAPLILQTRFLWLALHSYAELLSTSALTSEGLQVTLSLISHQMQSYTNLKKNNTSHEWEMQFLQDICKSYLSSPLVSDSSDGIEKAILTLASTPSSISFEEIAKPVMALQLSSRGSKKSNCSNGIGLTVLLHACLQPAASKEGVSRILSIVHETVGGKSLESQIARDCIIPTLALLSHPDRQVRELVIGVIEQFKSVKKDQMVADICSKATERSSPVRSTLVMDGADSLPPLLGQIIFTSDSAAPLQKLLIESCKSCPLNKDGEFSSGGCQASAIILGAMEKAGENVFPLSKRWDFAGKDLFNAFVAFTPNDDAAVSPSLCQLRDCVLSMMKGVLVNEAQAGDDGMTIQISIGPSQTGRRMRSYSIGAAESFTTLEPYPESMLKSVFEALSASASPLRLPKHVMQLVLVRQSWSNGVFPKLASKSKIAVASSLLTLRTSGNNELAGSALLGLPLKSSDFIHLLKGVDASQSEVDQVAVVFITDCIRGKLDVLGGTADIIKLSSNLFAQLLSLSSVENVSANEGDSGGRDYTRASILQALLDIHSHYKSQLSNSRDKVAGKHGTPKRKRSRSHSDIGSPKYLASQADLLVGLVGGNPSVINPLNSGRGRALALSLLTCLCEESPSTVVSSLLPALMSLAGESTSSDEENNVGKKVDVKSLGDALLAIVPAYCKHAPHANLSLFSLLESFVGKTIVLNGGNKKSRYQLLDHLVESLTHLSTKDNSSNAVASLAACAMALQAFKVQKTKGTSDADTEMSDSDLDSQTRIDIRLLANTTSAMKIPISLSLLQYAEELMSYICGLSSFSEGDSSAGKMKANITEVAALALRGTTAEEGISSAAYSTLSEAQQRSILYLAINLLQSVHDTLSTQTARRVVRKSKGDVADMCLRLWNQLMLTHSNTLRAHAQLKDKEAMSSMEKRFWDAAPIATGECLENLQNLLPIPHFLASVSSALIDDTTDTYIRKKSLRLLADRVAEVEPDSPEASLFLEMVPDLVGQINVDQSMITDGEDSLASMRRGIVMQQSVLVAIESFVRSLYPSSDNGKLASNAAAVFLPALAKVTTLLNSTASSWIKANEKAGEVGSSSVADAKCQLLSSCSLCVSTLVTTLKARCLPQLRIFITPLVTSLQSVNELLGGSTDQAAATGELLQLSILKTLHSAVETLPQFLLPYLPLFFSSNALPSKALRRGYGEGGQSVKAAVKQVETALATKVQIRQLIPSLSQALSKNLQLDGIGNWEEACSIINVMNIAVESSQRSELSPIIGKLFNGLVMAYGYEGDERSRPHMLRCANTCLLSLVMKLSEAQLRPLYARLREWRGGVEAENEEPISTVRRYAFWSLSAELSKSLKSIFLPCLTSVLTDVIDELEIAVSVLCQHSKKADGSKRRRVADEVGNNSVEDMDKVKTLQPILLCLESALKADAHEGGEWTRGDDNQRYNMILNHLGKLILAQVPKDISLQSDLTSKEQASASAYQQLVQGVGTLDHGNVVGTLTALATAAGNEQLWKPLNFAVLEACGHGKRPEVRKAGISCLLSIIETIGEEYMVLLPECLPVLSELLEDDDEIASMAKECVRQGEELLGESLEDSLR